MKMQFLMIIFLFTPGAGKTTLISVLTGLYEPTKGTARIAGYDLLTDVSMIVYHIVLCIWTIYRLCGI